MKLESMLTTGEIMSGSLQDEIKQLKDEKNAIILAHNYQPKEIQEIADFLGDSLELCMKAAEIEDKDLVIFCGVDFMAETAYILNPDKKIVIPDLEAECPMAHMLPEDELLKAKEEIAKGVPLSEPLKNGGLFPPMVVHMMAIGEETGEIEEMLDKLADYYDEEVEVTTQTVLALLEPMIIVFMAIIVVILIAAIMGPMLSLYNGVGNM